MYYIQVLNQQLQDILLNKLNLFKTILENGYGYESEGSVYFDVEKYNKDYKYGKLSGRKTEDMLENTRALSGQDEKRTALISPCGKKPILNI